MLMMTYISSLNVLLLDSPELSVSVLKSKPLINVLLASIKYCICFLYHKKKILLYILQNSFYLKWQFSQMLFISLEICLKSSPIHKRDITHQAAMGVPFPFSVWSCRPTL